jgi:hypothetical protein
MGHNGIRSCLLGLHSQIDGGAPQQVCIRCFGSTYFVFHVLGSVGKILYYLGLHRLRWILKIYTHMTSSVHGRYWGSDQNSLLSCSRNFSSNPAMRFGPWN